MRFLFATLLIFALVFFISCESEARTYLKVSFSTDIKRAYIDEKQVNDNQELYISEKEYKCLSISDSQSFSENILIQGSEVDIFFRKDSITIY